MSKESVHNPLDKANLGESIAKALLEKEVVNLGDMTPFHGAGIYALYYHGGFPLYARVRSTAARGEIPIYVGKAVEAGSRKGILSEVPTANAKLFSRIKEHADSIRIASNLRMEDFTCRFLVLDGVWIPLGEALLIARYHPLWNTVLDGFGNHGVGKERFNGKRPRWDTLHPGRLWAFKCKPHPDSIEQIEAKVNEHLAGRK